MPIYEYRCDEGHTFEVMQRMSDAPVAVCQTCEAPVQRVFHPVAVHFRGTGFYSTDYGSRKRAREGGESSSEGGDGKPVKDALKQEGTGKSGSSGSGSSGSSGSGSSGG